MNTNRLETKLYEWRSDDLKRYVVLLGGGSSITHKGKRITFICQKMLDKVSLNRIWKDLGDSSKRAISTAYHNEGEFDSAAFIAQYGALPSRPQRKNRWSYHNEPILFDLFVINGQIPEDLRPLLANLVLPLERFKLEGLKDVPLTIEHGGYEYGVIPVETELIGRADLLTYLQMVEQKQVKFGTKNNRLTAAGVRKVFGNLMTGDFREESESVTGRTTIRPFGLDVFTQESGLMTRTGKLTKMGRDYLQGQEPELMLTAFEKWSESGKFDELSRLKNLGGLKSRGTRLTPAATRREKVIEALSWCPTDSWIAINDFYRAVLIWNFDFETEKTEYSHLYMGSRYYDELHGSNYWKIVNGLFINAVIWEYLGTVGAVDIAFAEDQEFTFVGSEYSGEPVSLYDGLLYFRINSWGAFLLGQSDAYNPARPKQKELFTIDVAKRLHLLGELLPNERLQLEAMATPIDEKSYQLDELKLLTAVESGQSLEQLTAFLEANHQGKMLKTVSSWLKRLHKNLGAFKEIETAVLIQLTQPSLLKLAREDKALAKLCQKVDAKTILVSSSKLNRFRKRLKELGYLLS